MLTQSRLKEVLSYDPYSGVFVWLTAKNQNIPAGSVAGSDNDGYITIRIDGKRYKAHRLAWLFVVGDFPPCEIDHRDRNRGNNAWTNLRLATRSQQKANCGLSRSNKSGVRGVSSVGGRWLARITVQRKQIHLGTFGSMKEAQTAYQEKAQTVFGEFAPA